MTRTPSMSISARRAEIGRIAGAHRPGQREAAVGEFQHPRGALQRQTVGLAAERECDSGALARRRGTPRRSPRR